MAPSAAPPNWPAALPCSPEGPIPAPKRWEPTAAQGSPRRTRSSPSRWPASRPRCTWVPGPTGSPTPPVPSPPAAEARLLYAQHLGHAPPAQPAGLGGQGGGREQQRRDGREAEREPVGPHHDGYSRAGEHG